MFLGIEIGGTKLQLGVGDARGVQLAELRRLDVVPRRRAAGILEQIASTAPELIARHAVSHMGIGFGGPVSAGVVTKSHQIDGWELFPLADWCRRTLGIPVVLGNDCDAAALAEATLGAGRGASIVFYVTVGTGVGGGLVINGSLHGRQRPAVAEIGHLRPGLDATSPEQTVESLTSGWAIAAAARRMLDEPQTTEQDRRDLLHRCSAQLEQLTAKDIGAAAAAGNRVAERALRLATDVLGWAIAQVITVTSCEVAVVGGGVSLIGESFFFEPLREAAARFVFPPLAGSYQIVPAGLGELAVVHGALALATQSAK
jgi:glucokinase